MKIEHIEDIEAWRIRAAIRGFSSCLNKQNEPLNP
jgi:hypothetical protein